MTTVTTLIQRTRRFMRDWPEFDALTASCTSSSTTVTVANATIYQGNWPIQIDSEVCIVASGVGTTLTLKRRGAWGSTAASHANAATIMVRPNFYDIEILDALNAGLGAAYPLIYKPVLQEFTGVTETEYEYAIPDMTGLTTPIPYISRLEYRDTSVDPFRPLRAYKIIRGPTPIIRLRRTLPAGGTLRFVGFGPYAPLAAGDSLNDSFPINAEDVLVWFASQYLLASGESGRVRVDTGAIDNREQANRVGASMQASNTLFQRFQLRLRDAGMPPMPPHVVAVI